MILCRESHLLMLIIYLLLVANQLAGLKRLFLTRSRCYQEKREGKGLCVIYLCRSKASIRCPGCNGSSGVWLHIFTTLFGRRGNTRGHVVRFLDSMEPLMMQIYSCENTQISNKQGSRYVKWRHDMYMNGSILSLCSIPNSFMLEQNSL